MSGHRLEVDARAKEDPSTHPGPGDNKDRSFSQASGNYNPMLNPVVLERFFAVCDLEDLKRFRLVCALWNEVSLPRRRNQMTVVIEGNQNGWSDVRKLSWNKMDEVVPSLETMPYRCYRFDEWNFSTKLPPQPCQVNVETFFVSYGSWMRELTLTSPEIEHGIALKRVIFKLTPNLQVLALKEMTSERVLRSFYYYGLIDEDEEAESDDAVEEVEVSKVNPQFNLKILKVSIDSRIAKNSEWVPFSWHEYFQHFPNIETLELGNLLEDHMLQIVFALKASENYGKKIKKLDLQNSKLLPSDLRRLLSIRIPQLLSIRIPQLQLDELHVQVGLEEHLDSSDEGDPESMYHDQHFLYKEYPELIYPSIPDPELHSFIQERGPILRTLHLRTNDLDDHEVRYNDFRFQTLLESLTKLVLRGNITNNWNFLMDTPNLKVLHIFKCNLTNMFKEKSYQDVKDINLRLDCIEELRIASKDGMYVNTTLVEIPCHTLKFLEKCMPNLKVLEAPLTNETFRVVCASWKGLRELHASNSDKLDDEGITGMVVGSQCRPPNITHLKFLEIFSTSAKLLTYTSVIHGFLQLPRLHTVEVWWSNKISREAKAAMQRRFSRY